MKPGSSAAGFPQPADKPWLAHYDPGVPATLTYPDQTLQEFLEGSARRFPNRACTVLGPASTSYSQLNRLSDAIATGLVALGIEKGDRIGMLMPNLPQFVMAFYGILKAGGVVVATNPLYTPDELTHQLLDAQVRIIFVASEYREPLAAVWDRTSVHTSIVMQLEIPSMDSDLERPRVERPPATHETTPKAPRELTLDALIALGSQASVRPPPVSPDDIALFQYSGGTTGTSKAAVATHRSVVANTVQFQRWLVTLEPGSEVVLLAIPLYHAYGMIAGMSLGVSLGAGLSLVPNPRDITGLLSAVRDTRPTVFPGVPALYNALAHHPDVASGTVDLRSIRVCISGSTSLMRDTKVRFEELSGGKICEGYGLSEAPVVTHCNPLLGENKIGSIGMPMPDVECRVVEPENGELDVPVGRSGELILRGPQLMQRYHNMPAETDGTIRRLGDGKAWLFTGDIVRMDSDGYFYIVDRKKELIKPGGFQVWPRDVEEVLASHPAVLEVGVAGVPDPERGEAVKAWLVLRPHSVVTVEELRQWCKDRLAPYKVPTWIVFRKQLPRSNVGKVLRRELVREHRESTHPAD